MAKLDDFGFSKANPDPAMVYRTLRSLEKEECVESKWDTKGSGPAKRNYALTQKGYGLLYVWVESIAMRKQVLEKFLRQYRQHFKKHKSAFSDSYYAGSTGKENK